MQIYRFIVDASVFVWEDNCWLYGICPFFSCRKEFLNSLHLLMVMLGLCKGKNPNPESSGSKLIVHVTLPHVGSTHPTPKTPGIQHSSTGGFWTCVSDKSQLLAVRTTLSRLLLPVHTGRMASQASASKIPSAPVSKTWRLSIDWRAPDTHYPEEHQDLWPFILLKLSKHSSFTLVMKIPKIYQLSGHVTHKVDISFIKEVMSGERTVPWIVPAACTRNGLIPPQALLGQAVIGQGF